MTRSVYGQLNQANIGKGIDTLLREIFEGDKEKYATESAVMDSLSSTASDEASFQKLDKVLDEYWKRNDMHGPSFEAKEIKQRADYTRRKDEFYQYKEAHNQALAMVNPNYLVSSSDVDGGIQNITTNDVSSWNHKKLTEEMGKVNKIKDAFSLGEKGYSYNMGDKPQTSLSLARDIDTYYKTLTKALNIAVETDEIPKDEVLLRGIISGDASVVEKHMNEQQQIAAERYKDHNSNIDAYESVLNKTMAYEEKPDEFANLIGTLVSGKKPEGMTDAEHKIALANIPFDNLGTDSFELNYMTYANNINSSLTRELELRKQANKRHKAYTGKLYEDVGTELSEGMSKFRELGYSLEVVDEDEKKTPADGSLVTDEKEGTTITGITKEVPPKKEATIEQTDFDEKRHSINDPRPSLKKANGKFVFEQDGKMKEWNNKAFIKGYDSQLPVLDAGYDKYYWYNNKWNHISSAERKAPVASIREAGKVKGERQQALSIAVEDIKNMTKKLGYSDVGDATKKTKGKPVDENVYKYSKSLWDSLPKEAKAQFGSFNAFMEAVISSSKSGIEFKTE